MELQILGRWGMPNAAHLSRMFRATYGAPPAEFRARSAKPAPEEP
jgi:transcriptional regulator GlxA family with amidase domain